MKAILFAIVLNVVVPFYSLSNPTVTSVSFQLTRNLIIVKASVNGREGLFILDTGVSEIILNNRYFNGMPTGEKFYGISGSEMDKEIEAIRFDIGGFEKNVVAIVTDFTALEKISGLELFGVIGNSIFKNCEVVLDYIFKELTIYQLDKKGNRLTSKNIHQRPLDTLSIIIGRGVPYVEVNANGQRLKMSVDSGATANVMDIRGMDRLNSSFLQVTEGSMASFGPKKVPVKSQIIDKLIVGNLSCPPMKTLFVNMDHLNKSPSGIRVDGILGYEFLSNFRVAINFRKKEIYLWDRESVEQQWAIASKIMEKQ
jgi:hypothetical protein